MRIQNVYRVIFMLCMFLTLTLGMCSVCFGTTDDPLSVVIEGCNSAVSLIHSVKGKVKIENSSTGKVNLDAVGEYTVYLLDKKFRVDKEITYLRNEPSITATSEDSNLIIPKGAKIRREVKYDGTKLQIVSQNPERTTVCDRSLRYGITQYQSLLREIDIERFGIAKLDSEVVSPAKLIRFGVVRKETIQGNECFVVEKSDSSPIPGGGETILTQMYWISPDKGYYTLKYQVWVEGGTLTERTLVEQIDTNVRDYGGVWGPTKSVRVTYNRGEDRKIVPVQTTIVTYDPDFQFNIPISKSDLALEIPSATSVYDIDIDLNYTIP